MESFSKEYVNELKEKIYFLEKEFEEQKAVSDIYLGTILYLMKENVEENSSI